MREKQENFAYRVWGTVRLDINGKSKIVILFKNFHPSMEGGRFHSTSVFTFRQSHVIVVVFIFASAIAHQP